MSAKKPWEEEYAVHPLDARAIISAADGLVVADIREPLSGMGREVGVMFAAAPDMARALLAMSRPDLAGACWCHESRDVVRYGHDACCFSARTALAKAGVL